MQKAIKKKIQDIVFQQRFKPVVSWIKVTIGVNLLGN